MLECINVVFDDLGVFVTTVSSDHVGWFVLEEGSEKVTDGVLGEPVGDVFADRRIHQIIVEDESICTLTVIRRYCSS